MAEREKKESLQSSFVDRLDPLQQDVELDGEEPRPHDLSDDHEQPNKIENGKIKAFKPNDLRIKSFKP